MDFPDETGYTSVSWLDEIQLLTACIATSLVERLLM